jgi:hypothetical protein
MKDIILTVKQQKMELRWFCACVAAAFVLNLASIIIYRTAWNELWTQLVWVAVIGAGFYALSVVVRLLIAAIRHFLHK